VAAQIVNSAKHFAREFDRSLRIGARRRTDGAKAVVLSKGIWERLQVCPETLEVLANNSIEVEVLQTEAAVERFNELRESVPVGGLFHSTC
jgi:hypothetical protein